MLLLIVFILIQHIFTDFAGGGMGEKLQTWYGIRLFLIHEMLQMRNFKDCIKATNVYITSHMRINAVNNALYH